MNNFFGQLYLDLSNYLKTSVPELKWIDQDFGQLETFEYRPNVDFPCALIDFLQSSYSNGAELSQFGDLTISIRLGFAAFSSSAQAAPLNVKEKALAYYALEQKVFKVLQGWQPVYEDENYTQPFIRMSAQTEQRISASGAQDASGLRVRVLMFNTTFEDQSAMKTYSKHAVTLEVEQEIIFPQ
jgi:hypothetical protein